MVFYDASQGNIYNFALRTILSVSQSPEGMDQICSPFYINCTAQTFEHLLFWNEYTTQPWDENCDHRTLVFLKHVLAKDCNKFCANS
jgi:hypothetical protein